MQYPLKIANMAAGFICTSAVTSRSSRSGNEEEEKKQAYKSKDDLDSGDEG